jgi:hypothetical protein
MGGRVNRRAAGRARRQRRLAGSPIAGSTGEGPSSRGSWLETLFPPAVLSLRWRGDVPDMAASRT